IKSPSRDKPFLRESFTSLIDKQGLFIKIYSSAAFFVEKTLQLQGFVQLLPLFKDCAINSPLYSKELNNTEQYLSPSNISTPSSVVNNRSLLCFKSSK